jgi:hypothetical protein
VTALEPFEQCVRGHMVTKILHTWRCWERSIILFSAMWCVLTVEVRWAAMKLFSIPLSFLSHAFEIYISPSKKQSCHLVCNFIDFGFHPFNYYLSFLLMVFEI